jgi:hypothetical protein
MSHFYKDVVKFTGQKLAANSFWKLSVFY